MGKKIGTFGPLVIGAEKFDSEATIVAQGVDRFGPLVTGAQDHEPEQPLTLAAMLAAAGYTPAQQPATGTPAVELQVQLPPDQNHNGYSSIKELQAAIAEAKGAGVEQLDALIVRAAALEAQRTGDESFPRKGAFMELLSAEMQRDGGPRPEVHAAIERALTVLQAPK